MIYSRYVDTTKESSKKKLGITGSAALGVKSMSFGIQMKVSTAMQAESSSTSAQEFGGSTINVMGGIPVGDASTLEGFAHWAETVALNPMPIKYQLGPLADFADVLMLFHDEEIDAEDTVKEKAADNSGSSGDYYTVKLTCVPECYTVGQGVTASGNGMVYTKPLNISWESKCKFYGSLAADYKIKCNGCAECKTSPPPAPPTLPKPLSPLPPQSQPFPPDSPPEPPSPPPLPPFTAELFRRAWLDYVQLYGESGRQQPKLDDASGVLRLGGAECVDDEKWGDARKQLYDASQIYTYKDNWNRKSGVQIETMCDTTGLVTLECPMIASL